jgi:hypothetical protein
MIDELESIRKETVGDRIEAQSRIVIVGTCRGYLVSRPRSFEPGTSHVLVHSVISRPNCSANLLLRATILELSIVADSIITFRLGALCQVHDPER